MRAAWPLVISWARMGSWATLFQSIWTPGLAVYPLSTTSDSHHTYILQAFLLEDREQEPGHSIVVSRHDGRLAVSLSLSLYLLGRQRDPRKARRSRASRPHTTRTTRTNRPTARRVRRGWQLNMNLNRRRTTHSGRTSGRDHIGRMLALECGGSESLAQLGVSRGEARLAGSYMPVSQDKGPQGEVRAEKADIQPASGCKGHRLDLQASTTWGDQRHRLGGCIKQLFAPETTSKVLPSVVCKM